MNKSKAVVLLSGGLDSATALAIAAQEHECYALSFDYGQQAHAELGAAKKVVRAFNITEHRIANIDLGVFGGSALTDDAIDVPCDMPRAADTADIPITYVPARNTIFLSYALAWAEVLQAQSIFIGVNAVDYSGYPDCRPEYIEAFQTMANLATRQAVEGAEINIVTPLIDLSKADIIRAGVRLNINYALTVSCYKADVTGAACGRCDSCYLRREGFVQAGVDDPTIYQK